MSDDASVPVIPIAYPEPDFKTRVLEGKQMIWDQVRKKFVVLTPEEWVRQNFLSYLIRVMGYPGSLMAVEKEIRLGSLKKRCDIVLYDNAMPWMIVECKEPGIPLTEPALRQILAYNMTLRVRYLILTNGNHTYGMQLGVASQGFISALPPYGNL